MVWGVDDFGGSGDFFSALQNPYYSAWPPEPPGFNYTLYDAGTYGSSRAPTLDTGAGGDDTSPSSNLEIWGDSIAHNLIRKMNAAGVGPSGGYGLPGATPTAIHNFITAQPEDYWRGKTIALSSGSNPYDATARVDDSPGEMDQVGKTIAYLKDKGANVIPIGYGVKFPGRNAELQKIADANGLTIAPSVGTVPAEGVHPSPAGYPAMWKNINRLHADSGDYGGGDQPDAGPVQYGPGGALPSTQIGDPAARVALRSPLPPPSAGGGQQVTVTPDGRVAVGGGAPSAGATPPPPPIPGPMGFTLPGGPLARNIWTNPQTGETSDVADAIAAQKKTGAGGLRGGLLGMLSAEDKRSMLGSGLLAMSAALAEAAKPSLLPKGGIGAALGAGFGAFGQGTDQALTQMLQQGKLGLELQTLQGQNAFRAGLPDALARLRTSLGGGGGVGGGAGGGVPSGQAVPGTSLITGGALSGTGQGHVAPDQVRAQYIAQGAVARGLEPNAVLATIGGEGQHKYTGDGGTSFGDFQLHVGGGMGDAAIKAGINIRDPNTWQQQADFAMDQMAAHRGDANWYHGQWHGAPPGAGRQVYSGGGGGAQPDAGAGYGGAPGPVAQGGGPAQAGGGGGGGGYNPQTGLDLAELAAQADAYGMKGVIEPYTQWYYNQPGVKAAQAGAVKGAETAVTEPSQIRVDAAKARLEQELRERQSGVQAEIDRISKALEQQGAAGLELVDVPVNLPGGGIGIQKMSRLEAVRRAQMGDPAATAALGGGTPAAPAAPIAQAAPTVPQTVPGTNFAIGGRVPFQPAPMAPGAPTAAPGSATGAPAGPAAAPGGLAVTPYYTKGQEKEQEARINQQVAQEKDYRDAATAAKSVKATLLDTSTNLASVAHGPLAPLQYAVGRYARLVDPSWNQSVGGYEAARSAVNELVRKAVKQSDPNPTFLQTKMAIDAMPNAELSDDGLARITNRMVGLQNHDIARAQALPAYMKANNNSSAGFDDWWRANASPFAFVYARMDPQDQIQIANALSQSDAGRREKELLKSQIAFIKKNGLEY